MVKHRREWRKIVLEANVYRGGRGGEEDGVEGRTRRNVIRQLLKAGYMVMRNW